jgi:hypothetical protein
MMKLQMFEGALASVAVLAICAATPALAANDDRQFDGCYDRTWMADEAEYLWAPWCHSPQLNIRSAVDLSGQVTVEATTFEDNTHDPDPTVLSPYSERFIFQKYRPDPQTGTVVCQAWPSGASSDCPALFEVWTRNDATLARFWRTFFPGTVNSPDFTATRYGRELHVRGYDLSGDHRVECIFTRRTGC